MNCQRHTNILIFDFCIFDFNYRGFSLLELLIVVAILGILGTIVLRSFFQFRSSSDLDAAVRQTLSELRLAQSKTLASENRQQYGVHFQSDRVVLFAGASYDPATTTNEIILLPPSVTATTIALAGGGSNVLFDWLTGRTSQSGSVTLSGAGGATRTVTIDASGQARGEALALAPLGTRLTDTRHVNFQLGWSIQSATSLKLTFSNPPNPDTVQTVALSSICTGSPWTLCDWSGTVSVNGSNQTLRVHTITMSSSDTNLSIDRDRRTNDKALTVSIIDGGLTKNIVSYTAAGTTTVGAYGGTMTIQ